MYSFFLTKIKRNRSVIKKVRFVPLEKAKRKPKKIKNNRIPYTNFFPKFFSLMKIKIPKNKLAAKKEAEVFWY